MSITGIVSLAIGASVLPTTITDVQTYPWLTEAQRQELANGVAPGSMPVGLPPGTLHVNPDWRVLLVGLAGLALSLLVVDLVRRWRPPAGRIVVDSPWVRWLPVGAATLSLAVLRTSVDGLVGLDRFALPATTVSVTTPIGVAASLIASVTMYLVLIYGGQFALARLLVAMRPAREPIRLAAPGDPAR